jgi:hypothetical protein
MHVKNGLKNVTLVIGFSTAKTLLLTLFSLHLNFWPETTPLLSPTLCTPQDVIPCDFFLFPQTSG